MLTQLLFGLLLAVIIAFVAYRAHSLSRSGALAALVLGTVIFGLGGFGWAVLLLGFFISSSLLSRLFKRRKAAFDEKFSKGSRRDAWQVAANGGTAGLMVLLHVLFPGAAWPWLAFAGSLAAANADTWATELGVLSRTAPRLITTGKKVERGTSGGVSLGGTLAALGGAGFIALLALPFFPSAPFEVALGRVGLISLAGLLGSLADSALGATLQAIYTCPKCQKETERHPLHSCGSPTTLAHGLSWLNNDWVNITCTLVGALLAGALAGLLPAAPLPAAAPRPSFDFASPAFAAGQPIPARYTCSAENLSPALTWGALPTAARSLALVVDDPDAPMGTFTHWVVYNLPAASTQISDAPQFSAPTLQGRNSFGKSEYGGPCPPAGKPHRYFFKLYALDLEPDLPAGLNAARLMQSIDGHILAEAQFFGTFGR